MELTPTRPLKEKPELEHEFGALARFMARRYFERVRFPTEAEARLRELSASGFVVHVMRTTAWVNFLYLAWALVRRGLPPLRAAVNLRPWMTRPFRRTARRGDLGARFTYARRNAGSGIVFLKRTALWRPHGKDTHEDPFPALVAMARRSDTAVYLVPELFVIEKRTARLKPTFLDNMFGSPEAPGFLHSVLAFFRNYRRAQFRVGEPIDVRRYAREHAELTDAEIGRRLRNALLLRLDRETRAVFGPPGKSPERFIAETMRDRTLRDALDEVAHTQSRKVGAVYREARRNLEQIAARPSPTVVALSAPILRIIFDRIYDGIEVDEAGLERALGAATRAPIVLCPSHKSHIDYLLLAYMLWVRGYSVPLVAAGANLSFFPLGPYFRRGGAFFLRRSFKGDRVYTASFKAYIKKLVREGVPQEFFPEGGRSRTGKLLQPKLGMFSWEVEAVLEGAAKDLSFVPVAIDYERVVEGGSYRHELAGGEKKPEDLKALLAAPKVLTARYGRIHVTFDEPVSLADLMRQRGLDPAGPVDAEARKGLVRALGHRVMYGISRASTVTPHALLAAALLGDMRGAGASPRVVRARVGLLRRAVAEEGIPQSKTLENAPSDPSTLGAFQDALRKFCQDGLVTIEGDGEGATYVAVPERRTELAFNKNTLMNLVAPRALVAAALLAGEPAPYDEIKARALFLSRLFKLEFIYRVGATFDALFAEAVEKLARAGLVLHEDERLAVAPEPHARPELTFLAALLRDVLETYLFALLTLDDVAGGVATDRKSFVRAALERGRTELAAGRAALSEALSKPTLENALAYLLDQELLLESEKKLRVGPGAGTAAQRAELVGALRRFLGEGALPG